MLSTREFAESLIRKYTCILFNIDEDLFKYMDFEHLSDYLTEQCKKSEISTIYKLAYAAINFAEDCYDALLEQNKTTTTFILEVRVHLYKIIEEIKTKIDNKGK